MLLYTAVHCCILLYIVVYSTVLLYYSEYGRIDRKVSSIVRSLAKLDDNVTFLCFTQVSDIHVHIHVHVHVCTCDVLSVECCTRQTLCWTHPWQPHGISGRN